MLAGGACWQLDEMRTTPPECSLPAAGEATHAGGTSGDLGVPGEGLPTTQEPPAEMGIRPTDPHGPSRSPVFAGFTKPQNTVT